ncbi:hypothetical protein ACTHQ6_09380 [Arthrobacter sp. SAFR-179]|uniref:hypothetical protein n=1 Tax=Arthrobacter sp. SAFR-179 TaxID=3387279 RepID=UPI003F7CC94A
MAQLASNGIKDYTGLTKAAGNLNAVAGGNAYTFKSVAMVMTQTIVGGVLENIGNFFISAFNQAGANTAAFIGTLVGFFASLPGKIMGALWGAGSWLVDVGRTIVQGRLVNGVSGMISSAVKAVTDVGGAMLDGVKGFLGIYSPSRVFRDQVGLMIGAGVVQSIDASRSGVQSSVNGLVSVPTVSGFGSPAFTPATSGSTGAGGNIYVQNAFTGEYLLAQVDGRVNPGMNQAATVANGRTC